MDPRVWREYGEPLVPGATSGPLAGETVAVKDLYDVAGHRVGAGNPAWLDAAVAAQEHAPVVSALLEAGASVQGISRTDEFAYSLAGTNHHYGTPPNPAAPGRIPGGSSSGSAAAVALGEASIGLGSDTGGSVRVPAAYQGLFGIRTTHDMLPRDGLLPLAPTFDTVGWLTRDAALLRRVGEVLLDPSPGGDDTLIVVPGLLRYADPAVAAAIAGWLPRRKIVEDWPLAGLPAWREAFVVLQAWEAWQSHGPWLDGRLDTLGADVRGRFERARAVTPGEAEEARETVAEARRTIRDLVADRVVALPSAPRVAPLLGDDMQAVREATLTLTCIVGIGGLPAVSLPLTTAAGLPCGVCLVASPGRDRELLDVAVTYA
jgi:Asp-tRNA(Asn)/Glu-tRNA(Gln) amidotransferase A subunit family amidase